MDELSNLIFSHSLLSNFCSLTSLSVSVIIRRIGGTKIPVRLWRIHHSEFSIHCSL